MHHSDEIPGDDRRGDATAGALVFLLLVVITAASLFGLSISDGLLPYHSAAERSLYTLKGLFWAGAILPAVAGIAAKIKRTPPGNVLWRVTLAALIWFVTVFFFASWFGALRILEMDKGSSLPRKPPSPPERHSVHGHSRIDHPADAGTVAADKPVMHLKP